MNATQQTAGKETTNKQNTVKNLSNVTALHRDAHAAKYDPGAYARACLKGRAWSASPRALAQAEFINRHDMVCAWHGPKSRLP